VGRGSMTPLGLYRTDMHCALRGTADRNFVSASELKVEAVCPSIPWG
jgi:hypothetical protein